MAPEFRGRFEPVELSDPALTHEGVRHLTVRSPALGGRGDISLFVPRGTRFPTEIPLVLLLHGVYGSHWSWFYSGAAHRTAQRMIDNGEIGPMILATPSDGLTGDGSGYWPRPQRDVEAWIIEEVPACIRDQFSSTGPLFLSGLSMGGYGALRIGCKHADRVAGISAHSSITQAEQMHDFVREEDLRLGELEPGEPDILHSIQRNRFTLPPLRFDCGEEDHLFAANKQLARELKALGIPHTFEALPGGHTWQYWSEHLERTLRFFHSLV